MAVSYTKLEVLLTRYKIKRETLRIATGCTTTELAKIAKGQYMTLQSIERIVRYLSDVTGRRVRVDDILEFVDE